MAPTSGGHPVQIDLTPRDVVTLRVVIMELAQSRRNKRFHGGSRSSTEDLRDIGEGIELLERIGTAAEDQGAAGEFLGSVSLDAPVRE